VKPLAVVLVGVRAHHQSEQNASIHRFFEASHYGCVRK